MKKKTTVLKTKSELVTERVDKIKASVKKKEEDKELTQLAKLEMIKECITDSIPVFDSKKKFSNKTSLKSIDKSLCLILSDLHIGKKVPGFNLEIWLEKLETLYHKVVEEINTKGITELVVFLNGDITDGSSIYPGHQNYICLPVGQQSIQGAKYLADFLDDLSNLVPVRVACVGGNHGRDGKKGETTFWDNWDCILYEIIKVHLKNNIRITVDITYDWKKFVKVQGLTVFQFHGDDVIKGNPLVSIPTALVKLSDMWRTEVSFDISISGHFHLPMLSLDVNGREMFMNGSFVPTDDYTEKTIKSKSRTGQVCFIVEGNKIKDRNLLEV